MKNKLLKKVFSVVAVILAVVMLVPVISVHADTDTNTNTDDHHTTHGHVYETRGYWITRCVYNPAKKQWHPAQEQFDCTKEELLSAGELDDNIIGDWHWTYGDTTWERILSLISAHGFSEWYNEVKRAVEGTGPAVYVRWDGIMECWNLDEPSETHRIYENYFGAENGMDTCPQKVYDDKVFSAAGNKGVPTHFNRYWLIGGVADETPIFTAGIHDHHISYEDTGDPHYAVGNFSTDGYNLAEGIPSTKEIRTDWEADEWYGHTDVWARTVITQQYTGIPYSFYYTYNWTVPEKTVYDYSNGPIMNSVGSPILDANGNLQYPVKEHIPEHVESATTLLQSGTFDEIRNGDYETLVPAVAYQYLVEANFYDFEQMQIANGAYANTIYADSTKDVEMKCISTDNYVEISGDAGQNPISSWYADDAKHVTWAKVDKYTRSETVTIDTSSYTSQSQAKAAARNQARVLMADWYKGERDKIKDQIFTGTITKNDVLEIDGKKYMEVYEQKGVNFTLDGKHPSNYTQCSESAACKKPFVVGSIRNAARNIERDSVFQNIPYNTDNGKYDTSVAAMFIRKIKNDMTLGGPFSCKSPLTGHCLDTVGGVINVHTPVISPAIVLSSTPIGTDAHGRPIYDITNNTNWNSEVAAYDGSQLTQLVASRFNDGAVQLTLDNGYTMDWQEAFHRDIALYGASGDPSKYDEFVLKKWMKVPFEIWYNGKFYQIQADGYTDWIKLANPLTWDTPANENLEGSEATGWIPTSDNHWQKTPFYIPSYAIETGHDVDKYIYYKVEALNVDGRYGGDHTAEQEAIYNKNYTYAYADDGAKYVATYRLKCQLSGIIYDFMITGDSDGETFDYHYSGSHIEDTNVAFCSLKEEKRAGVLNRFGDTAVRYRMDGLLNRNWSVKNTIPLTLGKSNSWENMGYVIKGSEFSFSLKTIANLSGENDKVSIKPKLRYVKKDGTVTNNIKIYYTSPYTGEMFIEFGSDREKEKKNLTKTRLANTQFNDSYYDILNCWTNIGKENYQIGDWVANSAKYHNLEIGDDMTEQEWLWRETYVSCMSQITIPSSLRLISGEWEQLKSNTKGNGRINEELIRYYDYAGTWDDTRLDEFIKSMQTWYGSYHIPSELFIVDLDDPDVRQEIIDHGGDPDNFDIIDYMDNKGGIDTKDPIFTTNEGYLIVNFEIETIKDGEEHLYYGGGAASTADMWKKEGQQDKVTIDGHDIPLESGDVAIIDLSKSIKDRYKAGLFNIN